MHNNTDQRISRVIFISIGSCFCAYIIVGVFGYLTFGPATLPNIVMNCAWPVRGGAHARPADGAAASRSAADPPAEPAVNVMRIAVALLALFSYPLQIHPCAICTDNLLSNSCMKRWRSEPRTRRYVLSIVICMLTLVVSLFLTNIDVVFGLVGATGSTMLCYLLPGLFYLRMEHASPWRGHTKKWGSAVLVAVGVFMVIVGNAMVIDKAVNGGN